ncbi:MAG: hypothetical protein ACI845_002800 [Gammaproteobacteria bacterium]|jgi:uncharacterized protein YjiS (DUF1127 family)
MKLLSIAGTAFIERARILAEERKTLKALSFLSEHLLRDIGLTKSDLENLNSGIISLATFRFDEKKQIVQQTISGTGTMTIDTRILNIECANGDSFEPGKCG